MLTKPMGPEGGILQVQVSVVRRGGARGALTVLARGWAVIIGCAVLFAGAGYAYSWTQTPIYEATATVYITSGSNPVTSSYDSVRSAQERVYTYAQLVYSDAVLTPAIRTAGLDMTVDEAHRAVRAEVNPQLMMLTIAATDSKPEVAQRLSNAVSDSLADALSKLDVPSGGGAPITRLSVITSAKVNPNPVAPLTLINVAVAAIFGLIIGAIAVLVRERLNNTVRDQADAKAAIGAQALGTVPFSSPPDERVIDFPTDHGPLSESFRAIRSRILATASGKLLVTSARTSEGATPVALNLGAALARAGRRVIVVNANQDRGTKPGWSDVIANAQHLSSALQNTGVDGLVTLEPGTKLSANSADQLSSAGFAELLTDLAKDYDSVIVDTAPLLGSLDAQAVLPAVDRVLLVARQKTSTIVDLRACSELLEEANSDVIGIVLCDFQSKAGHKPDVPRRQREAVAAASE